MRKVLVEFIGTFFLMLIILLAIQQTNAHLAALMIGLGLIALVYMGGPISGAHYNPAVTFGFFIHRSFLGKEVLLYLISQVLAVVTAIFIGNYLLAAKLEQSQLETLSLQLGPTILAEILGTFLLMYVILQVARTQAAQGQPYYGVAIGLTVAAIAFTLGTISGGAFNPAVAIGFCIMNLVNWNDLWIFLVGEFVGAGIAVLTFHITNPNEQLS